jgi:sporulation protein YlmC with PRC-barrel domain
MFMKSIDRQSQLKIRTVLAPALALAVASAFLAPGVEARTTPAGQEAAPADQAGGGQTLEQRNFRATQLIGKEVKSQNDVDVGKINDLVINMDTGNVRYAVLSLKGDVGIGESRLYAIPVKSLKMGATRDDLVMHIDASQWKERKPFTASNWPDLRKSGYWSEIDRVSGTPAIQPIDRYFAFRASELIGKDVRDVEGKNLGKIRDLVIDMNKQKVHYAVLEFEPGRAQDDRLFQFPITSFEFPEAKTGNIKTSRLVLDVEPSQLKNMQGFDKHRWPDINSLASLAATDHYLNSPVFHPAAKRG